MTRLLSFAHVPSRLRRLSLLALWPDVTTPHGGQDGHLIASTIECGKCGKA